MKQLLMVDLDTNELKLELDYERFGSSISTRNAECAVQKVADSSLTILSFSSSRYFNTDHSIFGAK